MQNDRSEYKAWHNLIKRCTDPKNKLYSYYGGRGISVCERWLNSFENFINDVGYKPSPALSIDRIDNNGNYTPGNCRWATKKEQQANKRSIKKIHGTSHMYTYWKCRCELCKEAVSIKAKIYYLKKKQLNRN